LLSIELAFLATVVVLSYFKLAWPGTLGSLGDRV